MNNSRQSRIPGYLYALDGLRAVSLILIVIFHTWQQSWIFYVLKLNANTDLINLEIFQRYGYVAIDSFFVLSGFCLFYPIARDMFGESSFTGWKQFFIKRARRIYPSYILMLILLLIFPALSYTVYNAGSAAETAKHFFSHIFFVHNFSNSTLWSMIPTSWTLALEVQFYVLFPFICIPFRKKPILTFLGMLIIGTGLRLWLTAFADVSSSVVQAIMPAYLDVFGWGMISAYFVVYARNKIKAMSSLKLFMTLISAASIFLAICYTYWMGGMSFPQDITCGDVYFRFLYRSVFAMLIALFIFTACFSYDFWEKKIWGNKFFVFLSSISYTVYLWHQNIFIFLKKKNIPYSAANPVMNDRHAMDGMVLICFTASILIGIFVTKYIENPIVRYGFIGSIKRILRLEEKPNAENKHN